jgi:hypothetical protein
MSLQVRLHHTLGERLLELPDRPVDEPVVVGRSGSADVQVPSVTVASRHCVLFVHEGRWAIQGLGGASGTFVNGGKVEGPAFLLVGDVVTLGPESGAPTIEIDPIGAAEGRTGHPAGSVGEMPQTSIEPTAALAHPTQTAQPGYPAPLTAGVTAGGYAAPAGYPYPAPAQPAATDVAASPVASAAWEHAGSTGDDHGGGGGDTVSWATGASGTSRYYARRQRSSSSSGLAVGVLVTLLIVAGVGLFVYQHRQQTTQVAQPSPRPGAQKPPGPASRREEDTSEMPESIFDRTAPQRTSKAASRPATQRAASRAAATAPATAPMDAGSPDASSDAPTIGVVETLPQDAADAPQGGAPAGPQADDPAWKQVQAARFSQDEAKAILKFDDYAKSHPDQFSSQLAEYTEKAMDRIWFERLEQLCKQRAELGRNIEQTEKEMAEETDDAYKKRVLVPLKEKYANRLQTVEEELTKNMKYEGSNAPNLLDDAQIDKLRRQRDPAYYPGWKSRVLAHIRRSHGELPWSQ